MTNRKISRRSLVQGATSAALFGAPFVFTQFPPDVEADSHAAPRQQDWYGPPVWPPYDKLEALLKHWAADHPGFMTLEKLGQSAQGRFIYAVLLTDPQADGEGKEHALITALHAGLERSAPTTVMALIEWLLSGDPAALDLLRRQVVVCLPVSDPDRYENGKFSPLYSDWTPDGHRLAAEIPEATLVRRVLDRMQPELHADIHGTNLDFARYIMFESSGTSYSNSALRPYHRDIIRQMDEAALAGGFPSDKGESDAERIFGGPGLESIKDRCWMGRPRFYCAMYAYYHFHSLITASEVAWEESGVLRHRRLLEIGNQRWPGEYYPGYPTRVITGNTHARITAYGQTAAQRRRSRVELWNRFGEFTFGTLDPAVEGKAMAVLATSGTAERGFLADPAIEVVLERLKQHPRMNHEAIAQFAAGWPAGQNHPRAWLALQRRNVDAEGDKADKADKSVSSETAKHGGHLGPIEHGICLRMRLAYGKAAISKLRLNGRPLASSQTDGFITWTARGCTFIQVNLPPRRLREDDLFVLTCEYTPGEKRGRWDSWKRVDDGG